MVLPAVLEVQPMGQCLSSLEGSQYDPSDLVSHPVTNATVPSVSTSAAEEEWASLHLSGQLSLLRQPEPPPHAPASVLPSLHDCDRPLLAAPLVPQLGVHA